MGAYHFRLSLFVFDEVAENTPPWDEEDEDETEGDK